MNQKRNKSNWVLLLLGCWLLTASLATAQTFHLVVFADTEDPGLSAPNLANIANLTLMTDTLCARLKLKNQTVIYKSSAFRASVCDKAIATLNPGPTDIVFFYFMGHGWNNSEVEEPMMLFKTEGQSPGPANSRNLGAVFAQLQQKGARLTLAFAESCNSAINDRSKAKKGSGVPMNVSDTNLEQLKNLFLRSQMSIMLYSCKRGQKSNSSEDGGWFFGSFIETYKTAVSKPKSQPARWETLLTETAKATADYATEQGAKQEPVFQILTASAKPGPVINNSQETTLGLPIISKPTAKEPVPNQTPPPATPKEEPTKIPDKEGVSGPCAIRRTAFSVVQQELAWFDSYQKKVLTMNRDDAAEEFRRHYGPDRQAFFKDLVQKLNVGQLAQTDVAWFTETSAEIADYLDNTARHLNDENFKNTAFSKLSVPVDDLRNTVARVQDLLRRCADR